MLGNGQCKNTQQESRQEQWKETVNLGNVSYPWLIIVLQRSQTFQAEFPVFSSEMEILMTPSLWFPFAH